MSSRICRWWLAHRRWFRQPVLLASLLMLGVMAPFVVIQWVLDHVIQPPLGWVMGWLEALMFWIKTPDDSPDMARLLRRIDAIEAHKIASKSVVQ